MVLRLCTLRHAKHQQNHCTAGSLAAQVKGKTDESSAYTPIHLLWHSGLMCFVRCRCRITQQHKLGNSCPKPSRTRGTQSQASAAEWSASAKGRDGNHSRHTHSTGRCPLVQHSWLVCRSCWSVGCLQRQHRVCSSAG